MSDTPRTSEEWRRIQRLPDGRYSSQITDEDLAHGMCNFAKQLERELSEARKEISDLQGDVEAWKRETMIANARLRGEKHPDDNGAISTKEIIPKLQRELAEVTKQRNHLDMLIVNFCKDHKWAAAMWKQQNHVKPLFDYAKKAKGGDA